MFFLVSSCFFVPAFPIGYFAETVVNLLHPNFSSSNLTPPTQEPRQLPPTDWCKCLTCTPSWDLKCSTIFCKRTWMFFFSFPHLLETCNLNIDKSLCNSASTRYSLWVLLLTVTAWPQFVWIIPYDYMLPATDLLTLPASITCQWG